MPELSGLPGVAKPSVQAYVVSSVSQAMDELQYHQAVTAAGDCGAINAWKDDDGKYRAELYRRRSTIADFYGPSKTSLRLWLKAYWPQLRAEVRS